MKIIFAYIHLEFEKMGKIKPIKSKLKFSKVLLEKYEKQTARGYLIKCFDGEFFVDEDCFKFSDFLYEQIQGRSSSKKRFKIVSALSSYRGRKARAKFKGKKNNIFDFTAFRIKTIRKIFDLMHGFDIQELTLAEAGEALIYCNYDTDSF